MNTYNANNLLPALAAAAADTFNSADQLNPDSRGVRVTVDVTVATTTSAVINIQIKDPASGKYVTILSSAAITTVSTTVLTVYPGATAAANAAVSIPLGRVWRVQAVVTGGSSALTATVGASLLA